MGNLSGVNISDEHPLFNKIYTRHSIGTTFVTFLLIIVLSISGCIEPNMEDPDVVPDPDDVNITPDEPSVLEDILDEDSVKELNVTSPDFNDGTIIPAKYTCDGDNVNPSIEIGNIADDVVSLLLIMDDPDAPSGTFTHWIIWNLDPNMKITENDNPGVEGLNSAGYSSYVGPCPPSGTHRYFFKFYALDTELDIEPGSERTLVENEIDGHVVAYGELIGLYSHT